MTERRIDHDLLEVELIDDPLPRSSLGTIGRFVAIRWPDEASLFSRVRVEVPYSDDDLGWVDPATLRLFEIDVETREYTLMPDSGVDTERRLVYAGVGSAGVYGVVGLPRDPELLRAVQTFSSLMHELLDEHHEGRRDLQALICQRFLGGGDAYDVCLGVEIGAYGLPEFQLLGVPSKWVPKDWPRPEFLPKKKPRGGPFIYALLTSNPYWDLGDQLPQASVEIVDTRHWTKAGGFSLGSPMAGVSLSVAPSRQRLYILDQANFQLHVVRTTGASIGTLQLPLAPMDGVLDSAGSTLYIGAWNGLVAVDTTTLTVKKTVSLSAPLLSVALSPDGSTLAAAAYSDGMYIFDVATLTPQHVAVTDPSAASGCAVLPTDIAITSTGRAVLWDSNCDAFYEVVLAGGAQDHSATFRLTRDPYTYVNYNELVEYSPTTGKVYAVKESLELGTKIVGQASGSVSGGFTGMPYIPVLAPSGPRLWVIVVHRFSGGGAETIDQYDTITGALLNDRYTFSDPSMMVRSAQAL